MSAFIPEPERVVYSLKNSSGVVSPKIPTVINQILFSSIFPTTDGTFTFLRVTFFTKVAPFLPDRMMVKSTEVPAGQRIFLTASSRES